MYSNLPNWVSKEDVNADEIDAKTINVDTLKAKDATIENIHIEDVSLDDVIVNTLQVNNTLTVNSQAVTPANYAKLDTANTFTQPLTINANSSNILTTNSTTANSYIMHMSP